jgi:hypothetical protein
MRGAPQYTSRNNELARGLYPAGHFTASRSVNFWIPKRPFSRPRPECVTPKGIAGRVDGAVDRHASRTKARLEEMIQCVHGD